MSLINQMLRDLDQRQAGDRPLADVVEIYPTRPAEQRHHSLIGLGVALLLALLLVQVALQFLPSEPVPVPGQSNAQLAGPDSTRASDAPAEGRMLASDRIVEAAQPAAPAVADGSAEGRPAETDQPPLSPGAGQTVAGDAVATEQMASIQPEQAELSLLWRERRLQSQGHQVAQATDDIHSAEVMVTRPPAAESAEPVDVAGSTRPPTSEPRRDAGLVVNPLTVLERTRRYLGQGHVTEARQLLEMTLRRDPGLTAERELLLGLLQREGDLRQMGRILSEGLRHTPDHLPFIQLRARLWLGEGETARAEQLLLDATEKHPADETLLSLLAAAYQQQQRFDEARQAYLQLTRLNPQSARAWIGLAIARDATGAGVGAAAAYTTALSLPGLPGELLEYAQQRLHRLDAGQ